MARKGQLTKLNGQAKHPLKKGLVKGSWKDDCRHDWAMVHEMARIQNKFDETDWTW